MKTTELLQGIAAQPSFPVIGTEYQATDYYHLDLSIDNPAFAKRDVTTYEGLDAYVEQTLQQNLARVGYGGYAEHRIFYQQSPLFHAGATEPRCIHLGIDLWEAAGTKVFAPLAAQVHSFAYNAGMLDYGATIILAHQLGSFKFHTLYGHLSLASLDGLVPGKAITQGEPFAALGARPENGGWVPHLHFQLILDMEGKVGDYPGVATQAASSIYLQNCPNPIVFFPFLMQK